MEPSRRSRTLSSPMPERTTPCQQGVSLAGPASPVASPLLVEPAGCAISGSGPALMPPSLSRATRCRSFVGAENNRHCYGDGSFTGLRRAPAMTRSQPEEPTGDPAARRGKQHSDRAMEYVSVADFPEPADRPSHTDRPPPRPCRRQRDRLGGAARNSAQPPHEQSVLGESTRLLLNIPRWDARKAKHAQRNVDECPPTGGKPHCHR